jgi:hypothetical protein
MRNLQFPARDGDFHKVDVGCSIGEILQYFIDRAEYHPEMAFDEKIGWVYCAWRESNFAIQAGIRGRLVSGCDVSALPKNSPIYKIASGMVSRGVKDFHATRSVFTLPRELRHALRADLNSGDLVTADLDLEAAYPRAILQRRMTDHRLDDKHHILIHFLKHREELLRKVHPDREIAKRLFTLIIQLGSVEKWCADHGIPPANLPGEVKDMK